jgi:hypothetical protein
MTQRARCFGDLVFGDGPETSRIILDAAPLTRRQWMVAGGTALVAATLGCGRRAEPVVCGIPFCFWLARQQAADGGWHSEHYAQLRSGKALTPLVQVALGRFMSGDNRARAFDFIRRSVNAQGVIGTDDPDLFEYPNYATALALQGLAGHRRENDQRLIERMTNYLVGQQYNEAGGFGPDHPAYGGWGFGGARPVGGSSGHMDLGHTRHVLQALRAAGHKDPQTYARAEKFLRLMQQQGTPGFDGGFYFSPVVLAANKGGEETIDGKSYFRSYATATCDGVLALLACGVRREDERIRAAAAWLEKHPRLDFPEGVLKGTDTNWGASIRFYHFAVRAECYAALDWPGDWRHDLQAVLEPLQQPDGSFVNREGFLMKEDDPILCTALAVTALAHCLERP